MEGTSGALRFDPQEHKHAQQHDQGGGGQVLGQDGDDQRGVGIRMPYVRAFAAFWYDFLVGDRPELFVGPIVVLVGLWAALRAGLTSDVAAVGLVVLVVLLGALSLTKAMRHRG